MKTCDTCRAALKDLAQNNVDVIFVDVRATPLARDLLEKVLATFGDALVNRRSTTWRNLDDQDRLMDPVDLLQRHPTLMKRPLIEVDDQLYLGWTDAVRTSLIP